MFKRVVIQPRDAREASDTFLRQSIADVLLTYENEIVLTNIIQPSSAMPYIAPDNNVLVRECRAFTERCSSCVGMLPSVAKCCQVSSLCRYILSESRIPHKNYLTD